MLKSPDIRFAMGLSQSATGTAAVCHEASSKSKNPEVQSLARTIADSSVKMRASLGGLVEPMRVTLPEEIPAGELSTFTELQNLPANRIDHVYLKAQLKQLRRDIGAVKTELKKGKINDIQHFAIDALPVLEAHLEKTETLYRTIPKK
jgi:predicted outer membrane protein